MGAAQRRRQRRLRSWWRHEQQSIAAALATVMHHSSGKVHTAYGAPRSQKLATRAEEEVEYEPHYALRGQKTPPPGERPAPLSEVAGPQRSDRTVRHSAGDAPLLVVPSLRGADGVDGTTVSFLLAENLKLKKKEEEEKERRRKRKEAEHEARMRELDRRVWADEQLNPAESYAWRKWAGHLPGESRRKKKRKKKKLPRAPRPRQGCRRPCDLQRQVPAALRVLRVPRQNGGHSCSATETGTHSVLLGPGAVLGQGRCAGVAQRQGYGQTVQKTVLVPQLQLIEGRHPFVPQRQIPMVLPVQKAIETPQLQSVRWSMPLLCRSCHARCRADRCSWFRPCRKLWRCRSCSSSIRHLCRGAETDSHGPVQDHRNSPVATAAVVTSCSSSADCPSSAAPMCCGSVCVAMSCGGGFFTPGGAYDSVWDRVRPMSGKYLINYFQYQEDVVVFTC